MLRDSPEIGTGVSITCRFCTVGSAAMRFSVWPSFARPWPELVAFARRVEEQGWYGIWYADHYMPDTPDGVASDGMALECWSMLAALAGAVPRLRLGSLVSPSTVHHPALLAKQAATIDHVSDGRLVLGIGAGWQVNEHKAYGWDLRSPKDRVDRFEEFIQIVRSLLSENRTNFDGKHFTITDAPCDPKPVQSPMPIMVGSAGNQPTSMSPRDLPGHNQSVYLYLPDIREHYERAKTAGVEDIGRNAESGPIRLTETGGRACHIVESRAASRSSPV